MNTILQTKDLCKYYGKGDNEVKAVNHTNISVEKGEFAAIVGKSGSGKSTLLYALSGMDRPTAGQVIYGERDLTVMKEKELASLRWAGWIIQPAGKSSSGRSLFFL